VIEAHLDRDANAIAITGAPPTLRVRLGPDLVDLERELRLIIDGEPLVVTARPHLATLARTLLERGDPPAGLSGRPAPPPRRRRVADLVHARGLT
jgi:hypothetical protein